MIKVLTAAGKFGDTLREASSGGDMPALVAGRSLVPGIHVDPRARPAGRFAPAG
jgi:hypothetical protein